MKNSFEQHTVKIQEAAFKHILPEKKKKKRKKIKPQTKTNKKTPNQNQNKQPCKSVAELQLLILSGRP